MDTQLLTTGSQPGHFYRIWDKCAFATLIFLIFWAPLPFGSNVLWGKMLLCLLCYTCAIFKLLDQLSHSDERITLGRQGWLAFGALLTAQIYVALQWSLTRWSSIQMSIDPMATEVQLLLGLAFCCVFYTTATALHSRRRLNFLVSAIVLSGIFQAAYGSVMTLSGLEYSFVIKKDYYLGLATGTFINRNHLAGYLCLTLACGIGAMISAFKPTDNTTIKQFAGAFFEGLVTGKGALRVGLILMVVALVLTRSRMGNTAFFVGLSIAGALIFLVSSVSKKTIFGFLVSIVVVDILVIGTVFDLQELSQRIQSTNFAEEERSSIFLLALPLVLDNWAFGTGAGTFYTSFAAYRDGLSGLEFYDHAHNSYIEFSSERGLIGLLPLLIFLGVTGWRVAQVMKNGDLYQRGVGFILIMSTAAMLMHAMVDFNLQIPAYPLTLICIYALVFSPALNRVKSRRHQRRRKNVRS